MTSRYRVSVKFMVDADNGSEAKQEVARLITEGQRQIGKVITGQILSAKELTTDKTRIR